MNKNLLINLLPRSYKLKIVTGVFLFFLFFFTPSSIYAGTGTYITQTISVNWETFTGTTLSLSDDALSSIITMPFNFSFYGNSYNQLIVSSNGFISFNTSLSSSGCCSGATLPGASINNIIAGWWTDLYPPGNGTIQYTTLGTAPNRRFIVQFSGIPRCCGNSADVNFEIKLYETTNNIEIHYGGTTSTNGNTVTAGVEDDTGLLATADINAVNSPTKTDTATLYTMQSAPSISSIGNSNVDAISTSLTATVGDNNANTTAYFLWGTQNTSCQNLPNITDTSLFNGVGANNSLSKTVTGLIPGNTYYYCPIAVNSMGITYGTVNSFTQTGSSKCLSNNPDNDYTILSSCSFPSTVDGIDRGSGQSNTGILTIDKGKTLTINSGQRIAYGILYMPGASIVKFAGGSIVRGAVWIPDTDGDGLPDNANNTAQIISTSPQSGYMRRNLNTSGLIDCSPNDGTKWQLLPGASDSDGDGYAATLVTQPICSGNSLPSNYIANPASTDCNDANVNIFQNVANLAVDNDQDGYYVGSGAMTCVGNTSVVGSRTYYKSSSGSYILTNTTLALGSSDCDDTSASLYRNPTIYPDLDGDGYTGSGFSQCIGVSVPSGYTLTSSGSDCDDVDAAKWQNLTGYRDLDGDGVYTFNSTSVCTGSSLPSGYSVTAGQDCSDANAAKSTPLAASPTSISIGGNSVCMVVSGNVKCWGYNYYGQLGNGTTTESSVPVTVSGISNATSVSVGSSHACAILSDKTIKCWGNGYSGQLGNGNTYSSSTPVTVTGISNATMVNLGSDHTCALLSTGGVKCWGWGAYSQLGNGGTSNSSTPVDVTGISTATQISTGWYSSCARLNDGTVKCWGMNSGGLGDGINTQSSTPVVVTGITTASKVATDGFRGSCILLSDNTIKCWGDASMLGNGNSSSQSTPGTSVTGITTAIDVSTHDGGPCALLSNGTVMCWGYNDYGQLGSGDPISYYSNSPLYQPRTVSGITTASTLIPGYGPADLAGVVLSNGTIRFWGGRSILSQFGGGTDTTNAASTVYGITTAVDYMSGGGGDYGNCAALSNGRVKCWGTNGSGQLGNGVTNDVGSWEPVSVGIINASKVSVGYGGRCALLTDNTVKCWGSRYANGLSSESGTPNQISGLTNITKVSTSGGTACALKNNNTIWCWGYADPWGSGQASKLGNGSTTNTTIPVQVSGITTAVDVSVGTDVACAVKSDGTVWCWGSGTDGALGNGSNSDTTVPVQVSGISTATKVYSFSFNVCAVLSDSTAKCWGANSSGQLGNGSTYSTNSPVVPTGLTNVVGFAGLRDAICAVLGDGSVKCSGSGTLWGSSPTSSTTFLTTSVVNGITSLSSNEYLICGRTSSGTIKCWGSLLGNQGLGSGVSSKLNTPNAAVCQ